MLIANPGDNESIKAAAHALERETALPFSPAAVLKIKALTTHAFDEADVLGIRYGQPILPEHGKWMDRLAALYVERVRAGRRPASLAHGLLSHDSLDMLPELLAGRRVSVISCRDVKHILEGGWMVEDVTVYQVPSQHTVRDIDGDYEAAMYGARIWPDVHDRIRSELTVREGGEVFLVGAGVFGKDLCIHVRDLGGIAIDMGSAMDSIAGKLTRGPERRVLDLHAQGKSAVEIARSLELLSSSKVEPERVARGITEAAGGSVAAWRDQPLRTAYTRVCFEMLTAEINGDGPIQRRTCHVAVGIRPDGGRDMLGIWWQERDDSDPRLEALGDLHRRGVHEVGVVCADNPNGLTPEAVESVFPRAEGPQATEPIKSCIAVRSAIEEHGRFADEQATNTLVYLALRRAENEWRKAGNRQGLR